MKYVVAVSGGVDSMVLLDMLMNGRAPEAFGSIRPVDIIIAHFDHGIRETSPRDEALVRSTAKRYGLQYETKREALGAGASEDKARTRRYLFLRSIAKQNNAFLMTAHHKDDLIETIAINLVRGTGWRGLAVLDSQDIVRPLLECTKAELYGYAAAHAVEWYEDETNQEPRYLRNQLRQKLEAFDKQGAELLHLYRNRQLFLRKLIDTESGKLIGASPYSRYFFANIPDTAAWELLRVVLIREGGYTVTRPQLHRMLHAIKTFPAGKKFEIAKNAQIVVTRTHFIVESTP